MIMSADDSWATSGRPGRPWKLGIPNWEWQTAQGEWAVGGDELGHRRRDGPGGQGGRAQGTKTFDPQRNFP